MRPLVRPALALAVLVPGSAAAADDLPVELHFKPVPGAQIAIWLEDRDGNFAGDLYVTQATGKLGIGNRPGLWNFLSSWRAPYGPRPSVLPIWAHRRGRTYPEIVFHDGDPEHQGWIGWHEATSSPEKYFCIPLTPEDNAVVVDSMTCPSPDGFSTDKGRFHASGTSLYPPRNDILELEKDDDHPDVAGYAALNDLDGVTAATPTGDQPEYVTAVLPAEVVARAPLTAWIEVSLEHDENPAFDFDREADHHVDPQLPSIGVEYLGQPSVVYRVTFDPRAEGFLGTSDYAGYADWDGKTGAVHPPDATISTANGSGADRLRKYTLHGETFRFGVYSYGDEPVDPPTTGDDSDTGDESDTGDGDDGWGHCRPRELPPVAAMALEGMAFDRVRIAYTIPVQPDPDFALYRFRVYSLTGEQALGEDTLAAALEHPVNLADIQPPGTPGTLELDQLWANYTYQIGVQYEDRCGNRSPLTTATITTQSQDFQQVEGRCFLATAAYGAAWQAPVAALRRLRDDHLQAAALGRGFVAFYYTYSPPLARVVARQPLLRGMIRVVLQPAADAARLAP